MILKFDEYISEAYGRLTGENSTEEFARKILQFLKKEDKDNKFNNKDGEYAYLICKNPDNSIADKNHPFYDTFKNETEDVSDYDWSLPKWARVKDVVLLVMDINDDGGNTHAQYTCDSEFDIRLIIIDINYFLDCIYRDTTIIERTIKHEMKHYFDDLIDEKIGRNGNHNLCKELAKIRKKKFQKWSVYYVIDWALYLSSKTEVTAWLETNVDPERFELISKAIEVYLQYLKDGEILDRLGIITVSLQLSFSSPDDFRKKVMDTFGKVFEEKFGKKMSLEKYLKELQKCIKWGEKKHFRAKGIDMMKEREKKNK